MTNKEKVLAKWPDAKSMYSKAFDWWMIESKQFNPIGSGRTEDAAWADAERRLEDGK